MDPTEAFLSRASRPLVVSDIDGVLNALAYSIASALNARFGLSLDAATMTTYQIGQTLPREQSAWLDAQFSKGSFYLNAVPCPDAIDALGMLRSDGLRVLVATDRPEAVRPTTLQWLDRYDVPRDGFAIGPGCKTALLAGCGPDNPGVLIDDSPEKWLTVARDGVEVWSPRMPWTPANWTGYPNVFVFDSWNQVLDRLNIPVPA